MAVNRCICHSVPFARILRLHRDGLSLPEISEQTACCTGCGTCEPYIRLAIATDRADLPVFTRIQLDAMLAEHPDAPPPLF